MASGSLRTPLQTQAPVRVSRKIRIRLGVDRMEEMAGLSAVSMGASSELNGSLVVGSAKSCAVGVKAGDPPMWRCMLVGICNGSFVGAQRIRVDLQNRSSNTSVVTSKAPNMHAC